MAILFYVHQLLHLSPEILPGQSGGDVAAGLVHGVVHLSPSLEIKGIITLINEVAKMRLTLSRRPGIRLNFEKSKPK